MGGKNDDNQHPNPIWPIKEDTNLRQWVKFSSGGEEMLNYFESTKNSSPSLIWYE